MRDILSGFPVAFAMYSKIPVPAVKWTDKNMKYAICWFPLIGLVQGALMMLWYVLAQRLGLGESLRAAVLTVLPAAVTGGIHMDGFLDTSDALSSWKDRESKLEILKDSHCGAFAIICGLCYGILSFGVCSQMELQDLAVLTVLYVLSRALSGLALVQFKKAKNTGLLKTFADAAMGRRVTVVMALYILVCGAAACLISLRGGLCMLAVSAAVFAYYHHMSMQKFGGITGDLAGWFVEVCELAAAFGVVIL